MGRLTQSLFTDRLFSKVNANLVEPRAIAIEALLTDVDARATASVSRLEEADRRLAIEHASSLAIEHASSRLAQAEISARVDELGQQVGELIRRLEDANQTARVRQREVTELRDALARVLNSTP